MKFRRLFLLGGFLVMGLLAQAQQMDRIPGDILLQLAPEVPLDTFLASLAQYQTSFAQHPPTARALYEKGHIWMLQIASSQVNEFSFLEYLRNRKEVLAAQFNHFLSARSTIPNDPLFHLQWNWLNSNPSGGDVQADLAWDLTRGGVTALGDTIVLALIDDGIDPDHPDLVDNLWKNYQEIPNNGVDDDGNGYVDDYLGWNVSAQMDLVEFGSHGVKVAGILGARGNNQKGISGLNWNVKILPIVGIAQTESEIIAGMAYALHLRQQYQATGGAKGAFVVAANFSWGLDGGFPADAPIWCNFFDTLGHAGILSCAATTNQNWNVDVQGDLPTTCPSDFLISVTVSDHQDMRPFGGYSTTHIDLAAPGKNVLTTSAGNAYSLVSGTSFASPHVSGMVGLLYAASCETLIETAYSDPAMAALWTKDLLLTGADQLPSLTDQVSNGRRLNVYEGLFLLEQTCGPCPTPVGVHFSDLSDHSALVQWQSLDGGACEMRWRPVGDTSWTLSSDLQPPFLLTGLTHCQTYEIQIRSLCGQSGTGFSASYHFQTKGCCQAPIPTVALVEENQIALSWEHPAGIDSFRLSYQKQGDVQWNTLLLTSNEYHLQGLETCTPYLIQLSAHCGNGYTSAPSLTAALTGGCPGCDEATYCDAQAQTADEEWIEAVRLGNFSHHSGPNGGYGDFSGNPVTLVADQPAELVIYPGFSGLHYPEKYAVWADLNQNGQFDLPQEKLAESSSGIWGPFQCTLDLRHLTEPTLVRLRIQMKWSGLGPADPCGSFVYGETEDYCVQILPHVEADLCAFAPEPTLQFFSAKQVKLTWGAGPQPGTFQLRWRSLEDLTWSEAYPSSPSFEWKDLESCTSYEWEVRQICGPDTSAFSPRFFFSTDCPESTSQSLPEDFSVTVSPNPFRETLTLQIEGLSDPKINCELLTTTGKRIFSQPFSSGRRFELSIPPDLPSGLYWLKLTTENKTLFRKVIRQ